MSNSGQHMKETTDTAGKCENCNYYVPVVTRNVQRAYGKCVHPIRNGKYKQRTDPQCKDAETRWGL